MRWTLIFLLSLLGLAMACATLTALPSPNVMPIGWVVVMIVSAYVLGTRAGGRYFLHGFVLGLVNSIWVTVIHAAFVDTFLANNPQEASMMASMPMPTSPRLMMAMVGPLVGVATGVIMGGLAMLTAKLVARKRLS
jgi:hypothetical protein